MRVDSRTGSKEYLEPLRGTGIPAELAFLEAGDVEIIGRGLSGVPTLVGVELKQWPDVMQCIRDGRFADQQRKMRAMYEVRWLLVVGRLDQAVRNTPGGHSVQEVTSWLMTQSMCGGTLVAIVETQADAVFWLRNLHQWWTSKDFEEHRSHLSWYTPPSVGNYLEGPSPVQKVAAVLPGIGAGKVQLVNELWDTPEEMMQLDEAHWRVLPGVGKETFRKIKRFWRGT